MTTKSSKSKVFVIGLDGASFDIIYPMIEKGQLHTISRLIDTGTHGVLKSTVPDLSPVAWTSMVTGKRPGNHPIFDFISRQPDSYSFKSTKGGDRKVQPIWSLLSECQKRVGVINVTMSYPPEEVNGFIISGLDSPEFESTLTYPPSLYSEIKKNVGRYLLVNPYGLTTREKHLRGMFEMIENRLATAKYLTERYEWDFFMVVFIATDGAQHFYWKDMDPSHPDHDPKTPEPFRKAISDAYAKLDAGIGSLLDRQQGKITVMLVSDHGVQPLHKLFVLNNWLIQEGFLFLEKGIMGSVNLGKLIFLGKKVKERLLPGCKTKAEHGRMLTQSIDWRRTKAFADGTFGYIFINLKGREPQGIVNPGEEYDELCDEIIRRLKQVRNPENDQPVVEEVFKREEIFPGPYMNNAPDLIVTSRRNYFVSASSERLPRMHGKKSKSDGRFQKHVWSGNHDPNGILIINGPGVKRGHKIEGAEVFDVAPTILYALDQEIPSDMDGKALLNAFTDEHRQTHVPKTKDVGKVSHQKENTQEFLPEEDELIKKRLRDLGYLE